MRPRWYFALLSALSAASALLILLALLYAVSLIVFLMRESGALYLGAFGGRGWFDLMRSLPFSTLSLLLVFILVLQALARRYPFVYKKSLLTSILAILALAVAGGYLLERTQLHGSLMALERHGALPPPMNVLYRPSFAMRADDVYRGIIVATTSRGFVIIDHGAGTTTINLTPRTHLPEGEDFSVGDSVVVLGDRTASGTVQAFGVREIAPAAGDELEVK